MTENNQNGTTSTAFAWTSLIVIAELWAFYLLQKNVDEKSSLLSGKVILSVLLFGLVVPYSFRKVLLGGTNVPIANLYWIVLSQIGSVALAYYLLNQKIKLKDWIAISLLILAVIITVFGK